MDITIQIMLDAPTHDLESAVRNARRYKPGDIVNIYHRAKVTEPPSPATRLGFVHITGVPDRPLQALKPKLLGPVQTVIPASKITTLKVWNKMVAKGDYKPWLPTPTATVLGEDIVRIDGNLVVIARKRKFRVPIEALPAAVKAELLTNKEITVTWPQAKSFLVKKNIARRDNNDLDTEENITDGDI